MGDIKQRQDLCLPPDTVWNLARLTQNKLTTWSVREGQSRASITLTFDKSKANQYFPTSTETQSKVRQTTKLSSQPEADTLRKRKKVSDVIPSVSKSDSSHPVEVIVIDSDDPLIDNGLCPDVQHQPDGDVIVLDADVQQTTDHVIIIDDECAVKCDKEATTTTSVLSLVTKYKTEHKQDETPEHTQLRIAPDRISSTGDAIAPVAVSEAIKTEQHKPVFTTTSLLSSETCDKAAVVAEVSDVHVDGEDTDTLDTTTAQSVCVDKKKCKTPAISSTNDIIPSEVVSESGKRRQHKPVFSRTDTTDAPSVSKSQSAPKKIISLKRSFSLHRTSSTTEDSQPTHTGDTDSLGCSKSKKPRSDQSEKFMKRLTKSKNFLECLTVGDCLTCIEEEIVAIKATSSIYHTGHLVLVQNSNILSLLNTYYEHKLKRRIKITNITLAWIRNNEREISFMFRLKLYLIVLKRKFRFQKKTDCVSERVKQLIQEWYLYARSRACYV